MLARFDAALFAAEILALALQRAVIAADQLPAAVGQARADFLCRQRMAFVADLHIAVRHDHRAAVAAVVVTALIAALVGVYTDACAAADAPRPEPPCTEIAGRGLTEIGGRWMPPPFTGRPMPLPTYAGPQVGTQRGLPSGLSLV